MSDVSHPQTSPAQPDYSRKWLAMAAVATGVFLGTIDGSIVNVSLPTMMQALQTDFPTIQWVILGYLLVITCLLLSMGRLADIRGKKKVYLLGFVIFTLSSMLCGLAPGAGWLVAFRVIQAIGAAMVTALGMGIVTAAFPPQERGKALGIMGTIVSVGIAAGPALGGLLIGTVGWRAIFFVNVPVGIVGVLMVRAFVPDDIPTGRQRFDFAGAGALFIGLLSLLLALTLGQRLGFSAPLILALLVNFVLFLVLFLLVEGKVAQPIVDLSMFHNPLFSTSLLTGFMTFVALGSSFILPFYLQDVLGYSATQVGLLLTVLPAMLSITAPLSGTLSDRFGTRGLTTTGLLLIAFTFLMLSTLQTDTSTLGYILRIVPLGIGMGMFQSPNNSAIMGAVGKQRLGIGSGMLAMTRTLGQTTGVAVIGTIFAARAAMHGGQAISAELDAVSSAALVRGLHDAAILVGLMMFGAVFISALGLWKKWENKPVGETQPGRVVPQEPV
ncbi:MAG: MFS transporter [Anaerolineae bacterium]|nr:MFS transporter [Anaerolineae bacterium]